MDVPLVSVCLPNLNNRPFLPERLDSILRQTLRDWELVILDSFSDDGAWPLFQEFAAREPRARIGQAPREGIYPGWNRCLEQARGKYIYIATSDDTMSPDCLEKMAAALETHPDCDICHTPLRFIDEAGKESDPDAWFKLPVGRCLGEFGRQAHVRRAPYDGILHLSVNTVYTSVTQIMIRRTLFDRTGWFRADFGSSGDFEWGVRAGFLANVVYLPEKLGTWRKHAGQATKKSYDVRHMTENVNMVRAALKSPALAGVVRQLGLSEREATFFYRWTLNSIGVNDAPSAAAKLSWLARHALRSPEIVGSYLLAKALRRKTCAGDVEFAQDLLQKLGVPAPLRLDAAPHSSTGLAP
jgi:glycosyltransferase involved in cell wall biosynthesis